MNLTLGHSIKTFEPADGPRIMYIAYSDNLGEIFERAVKKWPKITLCQIMIEAQHIHTDCIGHDQYDPSDWTNYLVITPTEDYKTP